jgi:acyl-CoA thioester hydrolase
MRHAKLTEVARYRVLFDDCDPMRIMYYGSYFRLFEIGWTELFRRLGLPVPVLLARGLYVTVTAATCRYVKPARYDDVLIVKAGLTQVEPTGCEIHYEVISREAELVASGTTRHAIVDEARGLQHVPVELLQGKVVEAPPGP